mgnify:CR=1 FL=1
MKTFKKFIKGQELTDVPLKTKNKKHWGYHLLLDISGCSKNIDKEDEVKSFLKDLVKALDMKAIGDPIVVKVDSEQGRGISAVQIITTSTITFHGDDDEMCVYLDVFSCKDYDPEDAIRLVKKYFNPQHVGKKWIYRDAGRWRNEPQNQNAE